MNWLKVLQMLMISSLLVLLCNCGGGGSSVFPSVVQPTSIASAFPNPSGTASPVAQTSPSPGSPGTPQVDVANPTDPGVTASPSPVSQASPSPGATGNPQIEETPNPEDGGESEENVTPPSAGEGEPMAPPLSSPEPTTGIPPEDVGAEPTPDMIPEDELDTLFPDLPPDPGEEGMQTLEGIDADGDGIRDDVQRFIFRFFMNDIEKRQAMLQYARAWQALLPVVDNKELSNQNARVVGRAVLCAGHIWGYSDRQTYQIYEIETELVNSLILNTEARVRASYRADANLAGTITVTPPLGRANCDF